MTQVSTRHDPDAYCRACPPSQAPRVAAENCRGCGCAVGPSIFGAFFLLERRELDESYGGCSDRACWPLHASVPSSRSYEHTPSMSGSCHNPRNDYSHRNHVRRVREGTFHRNVVSDPRGQNGQGCSNVRSAPRSTDGRQEGTCARCPSGRCVPAP